MNEYLIKKETLDNIAIQSMNLMGKTEAVSTSTIISDLTNVNSEVNIQSELLASALVTLEGKAVGGEQATPTISVSSNGLIIATAGTKYATKQLAFQAAKTITPSTFDQVAVSSGYYTGGNVVVKGDSNLVAKNIK